MSWAHEWLIRFSKHGINCHFGFTLSVLFYIDVQANQLQTMLTTKQILAQYRSLAKREPWEWKMEAVRHR
jgi:hypothetical protein